MAEQLFYDHFCDYMAEGCPDATGDEDCLADYINNFLWHGGVDSCYGNFEIFLKAVALIVDAWHQDHTIIDSKKGPSGPNGSCQHRPEKVFSKGGHPIFNKDNFTAALYSWQRQGQH